MSNVHEGHRDRIKRRFLHDGLRGFETHEMLEMLLFFGIPRRDTKETAYALLEYFGDLSRVLQATYDELIQVKGITPTAAILVSFCGQLIREYYDLETKDIILDSAEKMGQFILPKFFGEHNEKLLLICMDGKCRVLHSCFLSEGSINATQIHIRRILEQAIRNRATIAVLAHNHPSGFAIPSKDDQESTRRLVCALHTVGIHLADHIIIAENDFVSMRSTPFLAPLFMPPKDL